MKSHNLLEEATTIAAVPKTANHVTARFDSTTNSNTATVSIKTNQVLARGVVYFDSDGNVLFETRSNAKFETWVEISDKKAVVNKTTVYNGKKFEYAPMPKIIQFADSGILSTQYQQYDWEIAAQVLIFNRKLIHDRSIIANNKDVFFHMVDSPTGKATKELFILPTIGNYVRGYKDYTNLPPELDPTLVKAICMKESQCGKTKVGLNKNPSKDIMQVNFSGDWAQEKSRIGLSKTKIPTPNESIKFGILWLYLKGLVSDGFYKKGKEWIKGKGWSLYNDRIDDFITAAELNKITIPSKKNSYASTPLTTWNFGDIGKPTKIKPPSPGYKDWSYAVIKYNASPAAKGYQKIVFDFYEKSEAPKVADYFIDAKNYVKGTKVE